MPVCRDNYAFFKVGISKAFKGVQSIFVKAVDRHICVAGKSLSFADRVEFVSCRVLALNKGFKHEYHGEVSRKWRYCDVDSEVFCRHGGKCCRAGAVFSIVRDVAKPSVTPRFKRVAVSKVITEGDACPVFHAVNAVRLCFILLSGDVGDICSACGERVNAGHAR